jgi:hypothetical protein
MMSYLYSSNLCKTFCYQSGKTWDRLDIEKITGISIGEESLTDINLQDLKINCPFDIHIQKFNRIVEAKNGADWEWWLISNKVGIGFRVQAKKIDVATLEYPEIYKMNKNGKQIDLLINGAKAASPKRIPLYVLYNCFDPYNTKYAWNCKTHIKNYKLLGCSIIPADLVLKKYKIPKLGFNQFSGLMYPWHCLVCCTCYSARLGYGPKKQSSLPVNAFSFMVGAFTENDIKTDLPLDQAGDYVTEKLPDYIYKVMQKETLNDEEISIIGTKGIMIINEKNVNL